MFWFLLISLVVVIAAITLAVVGSIDGDGRTGVARGGLTDAHPDRLYEPLPLSRAVRPADVDALRLPTAARGYRMQDVDEVLDRLGVELAERDARIAELESALTGVGPDAQGAPAGARTAPRADAPAGVREDDEHRASDDAR